MIRILYVEDNPADADFLVRQVNKLQQVYTIDVVSTVCAAQEALKEPLKFDLLLIDIKLPDGNGLDLLAEIRRNRTKLPVIILTGTVDEQAAVLAMKAGADDYISKHFDTLRNFVVVCEAAIEHFKHQQVLWTQTINVLYLEHNQSDIDLTERYIYRHSPNFHLVVKTTPEKVLEEIAQNQISPDVILLDYRLPGMDALELLNILHNIQKLLIPIIIVSGRGDEEIVARAYKLGATDYLIKTPGYLHKLPIMIENAYHQAKLESFNRDLLERDNKLRESNEFLKKLLKYSSAPIVVWDNQLQITHFNRAFENISGWAFEEIAEQGLSVLFPNYTTDQVLKELQDITNGNLRENTEIPIQDRHGTTHYLLWSTAHITDAKNIKTVATIAQGMDITERKLTDEKNLYLSTHDYLTGLYNRLFFDQNKTMLEDPEIMPLTVLLADVNGLKIINEAFGNAEGDQFLRHTATVLQNILKPENWAFRYGGDEFLIVLKNTDVLQAEKLIQLVNEQLGQYSIDKIKLSLSYGIATRHDQSESIEKLLIQADQDLNRRKLFEAPIVLGTTIYTIINILHEKNKREEAHSRRVSEICEAMGTALNMSPKDISELKAVGMLHDIGKIGIDEAILNKPDKLSQEEWAEIKRHPEIGCRILGAVKQMADLAEYVLSHHERMDGKGYPQGLSGQKIPIQSRIIAIADAYDAIISPRAYHVGMSEKDALKELKEHAGTQFDGELVDLFINVVQPHLKKAV